MLPHFIKDLRIFYDASKLVFCCRPNSLFLILEMFSPIMEHCTLTTRLVHWSRFDVEFTVSGIGFMLHNEAYTQLNAWTSDQLKPVIRVQSSMAEVFHNG